MVTHLCRRPRPREHRLPRSRNRIRPVSRPCLETLEGRSLWSGDVVLHGNRTLLDAVAATRTLPIPASRSLASVHAAVYDAVNAIDRSYGPYFAHVHAARGAAPEAAAAQAAH